MLAYFRTPPEKRRRARVMWIVLCVAVFFALLFAVLYACVASVADDIPGADARDRWASADSDYPFAQLSVCFDSASAVNLNTIQLARMEILKALEGNAVVTPEGAAPYVDAFSGETTVSLSTEREQLSVTATVCGGDFFFFHPITLTDGGYFDEDTQNANTLILDEYAAWQLFGATAVAGMEVTLGGQPFTVAGVSKSPTDPIEKAAYGEDPRVFVNYMGLRLVSGYDRATCYEIVLPNPIDDFAKNIVAEKLRVGDNAQNARVYDFTTRFSFETLALASDGYFSRAMRHDSVVPPYWENVARVAENKAIVLAFFAAVAGVVALICAVAFVSLWFTIHPIRVHDIYVFFEDKIEARRMRRWLKKQNSPIYASEKEG